MRPRFVTRNVWHSCGRVGLETHFAGRAVRIRELFEAWLALVERFGPIPQKTRISLEARVRSRAPSSAATTCAAPSG